MIVLSGDASTFNVADDKHNKPIKIIQVNIPKVFFFWWIMFGGLNYIQTLQLILFWKFSIKNDWWSNLNFGIVLKPNKFLKNYLIYQI